MGGQLNAALDPFIDVRLAMLASSISPLFSILKHDLQLSFLTSPSAFNQGQGSLSGNRYTRAGSLGSIAALMTREHSVYEYSRMNITYH